MLRVPQTHLDAMVATCIRALPNEGCGLLLGTTDDGVTEVVASTNVADSARIYEIDSAVLLKTYRRIDDEGLTLLGVFHSHTHSRAYPSPTDVRQAPDPAWHYVVVSLHDVPADVRSFRIVHDVVTEEEVVVE